MGQGVLTKVLKGKWPIEILCIQDGMDLVWSYLGVRYSIGIALPWCKYAF
jgi:hypothetical protein